MKKEKNVSMEYLDTESESKTEEKTEGKQAEAQRNAYKCLEFNFNKDAKEEAKSLEGEPEAEQAELKEEAAHPATSAVQSSENTETKNMKEEKPEGQKAEAPEKNVKDFIRLCAKDDLCGSPGLTTFPCIEVGKI